MPQARIKAIADKHDPANQFVLRLADNRQRKRGAFDGQAPHHSNALRRHLFGKRTRPARNPSADRLRYQF
jgi:hypothetical protein